MHRLERHILSSLIRNPHLRYAELKPADVEGNLFMYHLKRLKTDGLVRKNGNIYELTPQGKLLADKLQLDTLETGQQPRIVILMAVHDDKKGWLLHKRKVQPVINMIGYFHANIRLGESVIETAARVFKQTAGLETSFRYRGSGITTIYKNDELESYVTYTLLEGKNPKGKLIDETELGYNFWETKPDFSQPEFIPGMARLCKIIKTTKTPFWLEQTFHID